jgi:hypothetical protein
VLVQLVPRNMESNTTVVEFRLDRSAPQGHRSCWKELAPANMLAKLFTLVTFHRNGSLNDTTFANRNDRSVTSSPKHHTPIGQPYSFARELSGLGSMRYD